VEGVYIHQGRKRTSEHHPRGKGGGEPPRLIAIENIGIAFVVHAVEAVGATHGILAVQSLILVQLALVYCLLPVACCVLPVVCCLLSVVCCLLSVVAAPALPALLAPVLAVARAAVLALALGAPVLAVAGAAVLA
jgi:hypothetical protein